MASYVKIKREKKSHYSGADGGLGNRLGAAQCSEIETNMEKAARERKKLELCSKALVYSAGRCTDCTVPSVGYNFISPVQFCFVPGIFFLKSTTHFHIVAEDPPRSQSKYS